MAIEKIKKRDGRIVNFEAEKITTAIFKAFEACKKPDRRAAEKISNDVVKELEKKLRKEKRKIPSVEEVQDLVERKLMEKKHFDVAKAYILYRALHNEIRSLVDSYINQRTWLVKENSNMSYSLQGLNTHISSQVISNYWLHRIYLKKNPEIAKAHINGDYHIHNLQILGSYCAGWDMRELLLSGFTGVRGKISSKPAKHFRTALLQSVNFLYTLTGEVAGAVAFSNFDTYLAPFIRYDGLDYKEVKQAMQEFLFNMNVPCYDDKTEVLTDKGFKLFKDLDEDDKVATLRDGKYIEYQKPTRIIVYHYTGDMIHIKTSRLDLMVTPNHRMLVKRNGKLKFVRADELKYNDRIPRTGIWNCKDVDTFVLPKLVEEKNFYSPFTGKMHRRTKVWKEKKIKMEDWLAFLGIYLAEGYAVEESSEKVKEGNYEVGIVSKTKKKEIRKILDRLPFKYVENEDRFVILDKQLWVYLRKLGDCYTKYIPKEFKELSKKYLRILLDSFGLGDGHRNGKRNVYYTSSKQLQDDIGELILKVGNSPRYFRREEREIFIGERKLNPSKSNPNLKIYENISKFYTFEKYRKNDGSGYTNFKSVPYKGLVYCVEVPNQVIFVRRNGTCAWSGNTRVGFQQPFSNVTLDLIVPDFMKNEPVIIGGKLMNDTYGDFQDEMDMFNQAFAEVMLEGDGVGRPFSFPIPTINVTKDFDWERESVKKIFATSAKYGIPYFANFINSDMKPEDVRSMCLSPEEEIVAKIDGELLSTTIEKLVSQYAGNFDEDGWALPCKTVRVLSINPNSLEVEWQPIRRFLKKESNEKVEITTEDGKSIKVTPNHPIPVLSPEGLKLKLAKEIEVGDLMMCLRSGKKCLNETYKEIIITPCKPKLLDVQLKRLHELNFSDKEIAEVSGMHKDTIAKRRRKLGLPPNPPTKKNKNILLKLWNEVKELENRKLKLDEKLGALLGFFTADGNYIFESRKNLETYNTPRGIQFTFKRGSKLKKIIKKLIKEIFNVRCKEKEDPRWNVSYLYVYRTDITRALYRVGFRKYGRLPKILYNSPPSVIEAFLDYFFLGDGYKRKNEIHINDKELSRDIIILCSLVGRPTCYRELNGSQRIYFQHSKASSHPALYELIPGWAAKSTFLVRLNKKRMVGIKTLKKYNAVTEIAKQLAYRSIIPIKVKSVRKNKLKKPIYFYDFELENNHLFVHSLGTVTHNCCRLRIDQRELRKRGGGLFGANPTTGSLGVITINLPRIGYLSKDENDFFERLEYLMNLAKESLEIKRKIIEDFTERGLYPYSRFYLRSIKEGFGGYWKNHFNTIGLIGMNEACLNFLGCSIMDKEGYDFALKVLKFMREKLADFQVETGNIFNLEATPAESTSYSLAKIDKEKYPDIIVANEREYKKRKAEPFYTNSTFFPVNHNLDLFEYLRLQDPLQVLYTGGTVVHIWLGESNIPPESAISLIKKICNNFRAPYFTLTPTFSICPSHGYLKGEVPICPICGQKTEVYSRVVGYLRPVDQWNPGKREEFKMRSLFDKIMK